MNEYKAQVNDQITRWIKPYADHGPSQHGSGLNNIQWMKLEKDWIQFPTEIRDRLVKNPDTKDTVMIKEISLWRVNQNHSI